jgi:hypothetical protein
VPVTSKEKFEGQGLLRDGGAPLELVYGGAAMQGWRRTMEDAHIAETGLDGTGGSGLARLLDAGGRLRARPDGRARGADRPKLWAAPRRGALLRGARPTPPHPQYSIANANTPAHTLICC